MTSCPRIPERRRHVPLLVRWDRGAQRFILVDRKTRERLGLAAPGSPGEFRRAVLGGDGAPTGPAVSLLDAKLNDGWLGPTTSLCVRGTRTLDLFVYLPPDDVLGPKRVTLEWGEGRLDTREIPRGKLTRIALSGVWAGRA